MKINSFIRANAYTIMMLLISFLLWSFSNQSEEGTKKYCEVVYDYRIDPDTALSFQKNEYISEIWGNFSNYPNSIIENNKLKNYKNAIEALNYMGANGWNLVHHYRLTFNNGYASQDVYLMEK